MKIDIRHLRWIFLGLYVVIVAGLFATACSREDNLPQWICCGPFRLGADAFGTTVILLITLVSQALFVFCSGTINLCRPLRRRRLFLPVCISAFMMTVLVVAVFFSLHEVLKIYIDISEDPLWGLWALIVINWIGWGVAFFVTYGKEDRYTVARKLISSLLRGSLLELMIAIPAHIVASRRPGCFAGMWTSIGTSGGIMVMLWAFGPGIILLFLRDRYRKESGQEIQ